MKNPTLKVTFCIKKLLLSLISQKKMKKMFRNVILTLVMCFEIFFFSTSVAFVISFHMFWKAVMSCTRNAESDPSPPRSNLGVRFFLQLYQTTLKLAVDFEPEAQQWNQILQHAFEPINSDP